MYMYSELFYEYSTTIILFTKQNQSCDLHGSSRTDYMTYNKACRIIPVITFGIWLVTSSIFRIYFNTLFRIHTIFLARFVLDTTGCVLCILTISQCISSPLAVIVWSVITAVSHCSS
jgi:hypothetical protein